MRELAALATPAAVIFDLDGTLVDTVGTRIAGWLLTFTEAGIDADEHEIGIRIGADGKKLAQEVACHAGRSLSATEADRIDRRAGQVYDQLNVNPRPLPGTRELLVALERSNLHWAIATSSLADQTRASIAALHLPLAPRVVDGSQVTHAKPDPELLLQAAHRLGQVPADCWYVGDSTWDMQAARAADMVAIGVASGAVSANELLAAGATVVGTLAELEQQLLERGLLASS